MTKEERQVGEGKPPSRASVIGWRIFLLVFTLAVLGVTGGLAGYYINLDDSKDATPPATSDVYYVGVARRDVTGPIVQVNMMGYAHPEQIATGLHTRLYSRAFVITDINMTSRVAFVSFDSGMASELIKLEVVKRLQEKHKDMFTVDNVVISGTHTHSGPAGFFQYLLFQVTSFGHVEQSTSAFVDGIVESIEAANADLHKSRMKIGRHNVEVGNINRSPTSYLLNPKDERDRYSHDTEQEMTVLRFDTLGGDPLGMISWYPVHPTNMNFTNTLINSDNKGRASALFEMLMRKDGETVTGNMLTNSTQESYVAAFAQANQGDVSPRTNGPICVDTGLECDAQTSTCDGTSQNCVGFGPGKDMFDSTDIIARRQYEAGRKAFDGATDVLSGPIEWIHQYVDMTQATVTLDDGSNVTTCKPGMGYSFAAGCTDGAGAFDFIQGMTHGTPFWNTVRDVIAGIVCTTSPPEEYYDCHKPKPVLLPTGYMDKPYAWHPDVVSLQILRLGHLLIAAVPGEFSTMAGRRLKEALKEEAVQKGMPPNTTVVIAGLSNVYTHYITTPEEYAAQRYEAASTIYGPHTFQVYQKKYLDLLRALAEGRKDDVEVGPQPEISNIAQSPIAPLPNPDKVPANVSFGDVIDDANLTYSPSDVVKVKFYAANPRHNMKIGSTYLEVQRKNGSSWQTVYNDADWSTKISWEEKNATTTSSDPTLFSSMCDVIAASTGLKFDLDRAMALRREGKFVTSQRNHDVSNGNVVSAANDRIIDEMVAKGVVYEVPAKPAPKATSVEGHVTIEWAIPSSQEEANYRILYHGDYKTEDDVITPFTGTSLEFTVIARALLFH